MYEISCAIEENFILKREDWIFEVIQWSIMAGYTNQDNYWSQPQQNQYNFEPTGFGQQDQQFEFQSYSDQQAVDYSYTQKGFLDPTQSAYGNDVYGQDSFTKGMFFK